MLSGIIKGFVKKLPFRGSREISRQLAIFEGCTARTVLNLTSGAFMAGYLKFMGANDDIIAKILALPVLASMVQFISPVFIERLNWKKKMITIGCTIHRLLLSLMVVIPFLSDNVHFMLWTCGGIYFVSYITVAFVNPAVSNMYISFIPSNMRGRYFGTRESFILVFSTIITLFMGKILDICKDVGNEHKGYIFLFITVFAILILNTLSFVLMREVRIKPGMGKYRIRDVFIVPLKDKSFRKMILLFFIWSFGLHFGSPFFSVYMVSQLQLSYTFITVNSMIMSLFYLLFSRMWGRYADKSGWTSAVMYSIGILGIVHFLWLFVFKGSSIYVIIPLLNALSGIAWSGINISLFNIQFEFSPIEGRTLYIGFNTALSGIIGYCASFLSSLFVGLFEGFRINLAGIPIGIIQLVFSISGIIIIVAAFYLYYIAKMKNHHQLVKTGGRT